MLKCATTNISVEPVFVKRVLLTLAIGILASSTLYGQPGARPAPRVDRLRCTVDSFAVTLIRAGVRQRTGTIVDECRLSGIGASQLLTRVYRTTDEVLGNRLDTIVDVAATLEPRWYHSTTSRESRRLAWSDGRVRGQVRPVNAAVVPVDDESKPGVFNGASVDIVLRASPLTRNYSVRIPTYVSNRGEVIVTATVLGEEVVGQFRTWKVNADFGGLPVSFWIDTTTRQLRKQVMQMAADAAIEFTVLTR